jgi:hypothetical protein
MLCSRCNSNVMTKDGDHAARWPTLPMQALRSALHPALELGVLGSRLPGRRHRLGGSLVCSVPPELRRGE